MGGIYYRPFSNQIFIKSTKLSRMIIEKECCHLKMTMGGESTCENRISFMPCLQE